MTTKLIQQAERISILTQLHK